MTYSLKEHLFFLAFGLGSMLLVALLTYAAYRLNTPIENWHWFAIASLGTIFTGGLIIVVMSLWDLIK